jgi:hypothetical protein
MRQPAVADDQIHCLPLLRRAMLARRVEERNPTQCAA